MTSPTDLNAKLAAAARSMQTATSTESTLERLVEIAVEVVEGCEHAGISIVYRRAPIDSAAASSDLVRRGDELQYELQEGPCLDAIWTSETVHSPDLVSDERWPRWGPRVTEELGIRSMLSFQLFTDRDSLGALNLYSSQVDPFDESAHQSGFVLAAMGAVALAEARQVVQLRTAAVRRTVIGQAQGILMERFKIKADRAFTILARVSQTHNLKLYDVASEIVETGTLSDPEPTGS